MVNSAVASGAVGPAESHDDDLKRTAMYVSEATTKVLVCGAGNSTHVSAAIIATIIGTTPDWGVTLLSLLAQWKAICN